MGTHGRVDINWFWTSYQDESDLASLLMAKSDVHIQNVTILPSDRVACTILQVYMVNWFLVDFFSLASLVFLNQYIQTGSIDICQFSNFSW